MNQRPDLLELVIRFVCGFALAWALGRQIWGGSTPFLVALGTGVLAAWLGDALWATLARYLPWRR